MAQRTFDVVTVLVIVLLTIGEYKMQCCPFVNAERTQWARIRTSNSNAFLREEKNSSTKNETSQGMKEEILKNFGRPGAGNQFESSERRDFNRKKIKEATLGTAVIFVRASVFQNAHLTSHTSHTYLTH